MTVPGAIPPDLFTALAALFLLLGVPLILFALIMLYTGYVRYDAEKYLEELEEEADERGGRGERADNGERPGHDERTKSESAGGDRSESATATDEEPFGRHSPATSEGGVADDSDDGSTDSVVEDDPKSP
ncbi:hypothetical protein [Halostagnicola sp. A-GB9-2]|uniref:hypothetical protein n=1 Tax=Halostagnicola sp. A-GB9-2 TaxID=3048066 RepID=UPI0024C087FC|nr:hypothetical protein [Halostagnicola sp. A-GB9-2]MDJ1431769.1 hypothetical protein [Halostagnicola sp. A-GB9-2]